MACTPKTSTSRLVTRLNPRTFCEQANAKPIGLSDSTSALRSPVNAPQWPLQEIGEAAAVPGTTASAVSAHTATRAASARPRLPVLLVPPEAVIDPPLVGCSLPAASSAGGGECGVKMP